MKFTGIIPARYASTRFPGKPLIDINGTTMIERVYRQCEKSELSEVYVATDDTRISDVVKNFGGKVIMTSESHQSGTDRCAEAVADIATDVIINIQGDEPFIDPSQINLLCNCFSDDQVEIATLIKKIESREILFNTNTPKVVIDSKRNAVYFSRNIIPHIRNAEHDQWLSLHTFYKHIGIYAYRKQVLSELAVLKPSVLEKAEQLEQLRWIENGYHIRTEITEIETIAIDTPEDLMRITSLLKK